MGAAHLPNASPSDSPFALLLKWCERQLTRGNTHHSLKDYGPSWDSGHALYRLVSTLIQLQQGVVDPLPEPMPPHLCTSFDILDAAVAAAEESLGVLPLLEDSSLLMQDGRALAIYLTELHAAVTLAAAPPLQDTAAHAPPRSAQSPFPAAAQEHSSAPGAFDDADARERQAAAVLGPVLDAERTLQDLEQQYLDDGSLLLAFIAQGSAQLDQMLADAQRAMDHTSLLGRPEHHREEDAAGWTDFASQKAEHYERLRVMQLTLYHIQTVRRDRCKPAFEPQRPELQVTALVGQWQALLRAEAHCRRRLTLQARQMKGARSALHTLERKCTLQRNWAEQQRVILLRGAAEEERLAKTDAAAGRPNSIARALERLKALEVTVGARQSRVADIKAMAGGLFRGLGWHCEGEEAAQPSPGSSGPALTPMPPPLVQKRADSLKTAAALEDGWRTLVAAIAPRRRLLEEALAAAKHVASLNQLEASAAELLKRIMGVRLRVESDEDNADTLAGLELEAASVAEGARRAAVARQQLATGTSAFYAALEASSSSQARAQQRLETALATFRASVKHVQGIAEARSLLEALETEARAATTTLQSIAPMATSVREPVHVQGVSPLPSPEKPAKAAKSAVVGTDGSGGDESDTASPTTSASTSSTTKSSTFSPSASSRGSPRTRRRALPASPVPANHSPHRPRRSSMDRPLWSNMAIKFDPRPAARAVQALKQRLEGMQQALVSAGEACRGVQSAGRLRIPAEVQSVARQLSSRYSSLQTQVKGLVSGTQAVKAALTSLEHMVECHHGAELLADGAERLVQEGLSILERAEQVPASTSLLSQLRRHMSGLRTHGAALLQNCSRSGKELERLNAKHSSASVTSRMVTASYVGGLPGDTARLAKLARQALDRALGFLQTHETQVAQIESALVDWQRQVEAREELAALQRWVDLEEKRHDGHVARLNQDGVGALPSGSRPGVRRRRSSSTLTGLLASQGNLSEVSSALHQLRQSPSPLRDAGGPTSRLSRRALSSGQLDSPSVAAANGALGRRPSSLSVSRASTPGFASPSATEVHGRQRRTSSPFGTVESRLSALPATGERRASPSQLRLSLGSTADDGSPLRQGASPTRGEARWLRQPSPPPDHTMSMSAEKAALQQRLQELQAAVERDVASERALALAELYHEQLEASRSRLRDAPPPLAWSAAASAAQDAMLATSERAVTSMAAQATTELASLERLQGDVFAAVVDLRQLALAADQAAGRHDATQHDLHLTNLASGADELEQALKETMAAWSAAQQQLEKQRQGAAFARHLAESQRWLQAAVRECTTAREQPASVHMADLQLEAMEQDRSVRSAALSGVVTLLQEVDRWMAGESLEASLVESLTSARDAVGTLAEEYTAAADASRDRLEKMRSVLVLQAQADTVAARLSSVDARLAECQTPLLAPDCDIALRRLGQLQTMLAAPARSLTLLTESLEGATGMVAAATGSQADGGGELRLPDAASLQQRHDTLLARLEERRARVAWHKMALQAAEDAGEAMAWLQLQAELISSARVELAAAPARHLARLQHLEPGMRAHAEAAEDVAAQSAACVASAPPADQASAEFCDDLQANMEELCTTAGDVRALFDAELADAQARLRTSREEQVVAGLQSDVEALLVAVADLQPPKVVQVAAGSLHLRRCDALAQQARGLADRVEDMLTPEAAGEVLQVQQPQLRARLKTATAELDKKSAAAHLWHRYARWHEEASTAMSWMSGQQGILQQRLAELAVHGDVEAVGAAPRAVHRLESALATRSEEITVLAQRGASLLTLGDLELHFSDLEQLVEALPEAMENLRRSARALSALLALRAQSSGLSVACADAQAFVETVVQPTLARDTSEGFQDPSLAAQMLLEQERVLAQLDVEEKGLAHELRAFEERTGAVESAEKVGHGAAQLREAVLARAATTAALLSSGREQMIKRAARLRSMRCYTDFMRTAEDMTAWLTRAEAELQQLSDEAQRCVDEESEEAMVGRLGRFRDLVSTKRAGLEALEQLLADFCRVRRKGMGSDAWRRGDECTKWQRHVSWRCIQD